MEVSIGDICGLFPEETDRPLETFEEVEAEVVKNAIKSLLG